ncbi:hypothetical protein CU102_21825 [Phyllobacterium brassicacearum]|uniref:DUF3011 domain-containing protein n=1 Tax=Phyllobacterium brassicacearum TaxID=314235 RepID=A0A2P7BCX4_9HYPH|nr:DUF3011 domain-containing protein [Phyllobacterium brassicacearum]PSH64334.1 hypothetical protein CU102_21825 [Phyllobacterium brassicacearum]TDQ21252.1 hypothetical protein DEV91_12038 [Phyllobacterium brassicacearum]
MYRYILAFVIALGGSQFLPEPAQAQNSVKCESRKFRYTECDVDMRRPRIARQISRSPCIAGDTWGYNRGTIWVDKGCAAVFADSGRRPRRDWDDDRYPPRRDDYYRPRNGVEFELDF